MEPTHGVQGSKHLFLLPPFPPVQHRGELAWPMQVGSPLAVTCYLTITYNRRARELHNWASR